MADKEIPKILLVDDKPENLKALVRILEDFDAELVTATNGNDALSRTLHQEFALILLDVQMPGMDGFETAELMCSRIETPIIFVTANSREYHDVAKGYESGAVDYLVKPINPYILKSKVQVFLTLYEHQHSLVEKTEELAGEIRQRQAAEAELKQARDSLKKTVTERTRELQEAYQDLKERDERIRLVIDNIPAMVAFVDRERRYLFSNKQYEQYVSVSESMQGQSMKEILSDEIYGRIESYIDTVFTGQKVHFELEAAGLDDRSVVLLADYIPYRVDETVVGFFSLIQDVTNRREAEWKHRQMESQFRQLKKLKTLATLTGGVAHEFNNLLVPIIGFSKMVRDVQAEGSSEANYMDRVIRAAYRARDIVFQVRLFSRKQETRYDSLDLGSALEEALTSVRQVLPENIHLTTDIRKNLRPIMGNAGTIGQLVQNICENAIEAMPEGGELSVRLLCCRDNRLQASESPEDGYDCMHLEFEDTGNGMTPEIQDQIFDPFFSTRDQSSHTGLGLSVVLGIVEQMDGKIEVESSPERGTRFTIVLPTVHCRADKTDTTDENGIQQSDISVLIVGEETGMLDLNRQYLEFAGYRVTTDSDGIHAMAVLNKSPYSFDAIVADQSMHLISGLELAEKIKLIRPDIPVVLITGLIDEELKTNCRKYGVKHIIQKPFGADEINETIQKALLEKSGA